MNSVVLGTLFLVFIIFSYLSWWVAGVLFKKWDLKSKVTKSMALPSMFNRFSILAAVMITFAFMVLCRSTIYFQAVNHANGSNNYVLYSLGKKMGYSTKGIESDLVKDISENVHLNLENSPQNKKDSHFFLTRYINTLCKDKNNKKLYNLSDETLKKLYEISAKNKNPFENLEDMLSELVNGLNESIKENIKTLYLFDTFSFSILPPRLKKSREILNRMDDNANTINSRIESKISTQIEGGETHLKVVTSYMDKINDEFAPFYRGVSIFWGPLQFFTICLYFGGLISLRARRYLLKTDERWFETISGVNTASELLNVDELKQFSKKDMIEKPLLVSKEFAFESYKFFKEGSSQDINDTKKRFELKTTSWIESVHGRITNVEYTMVDFVIYGMPNLGFLGTVIGIGMAMAKIRGFQGMGSDPTAINNVTAMLSVAFDTTFVALACSFPLMALLHWVRRDEYSYLENVEQKFKNINVEKNFKD